jgi:Ycf66 protein N-terminus
MVNFNFNLASISGIVLAVGGAALYLVRSARPELSRDHDIFFSAVGLLCGLILIFYGWRFDPIMQFGQVLLTGSTIFFTLENLRLRKVSTEQAKKNMPIVDNERPVSRTYRADLDNYDEINPMDDRRPRRLQGTRDGRNSREEDDRMARRSSPNRSRDGRDDRPNEGDTYGDAAERPRKRRPRADDVAPNGMSGSDSYDEWGGQARSRNTPPRDEPSARPASRPRRPRPAEDEFSRRPDQRNDAVEDTSYVEYRPVSPRDDEPADSWGKP